MSTTTTTTTDTSTECRIYVASLSDYNDGRLHGTWIDLDGLDTDDVWQQINAMLAASPFNTDPALVIYGPAEEWAVHDHEGFGTYQLGEYPSIEKVVEIAAGIAEHGDIFGTWVDVADDLGCELDSFADHYRGEWDSFEDYATEMYDDCMSRELRELIDSNNYVTIDYAGFASDLASSYTIIEDVGTVHVFEDDA